MRAIDRQLWIVLLAMGAMAGCQEALRTDRPTDQPGALVMGYPQGAPLGEDLDIIVRQEGGDIVVLNRTAGTYPKLALWLNQQYVRVVDRLPIGEAVELSLEGFFNERGQPYPVGGLLSPDRTAVLVLAELYDAGAGMMESGGNGGVRYRLLVRR